MKSFRTRLVNTGFAQFMGTPLYMSPEHAEFSNVDDRRFS
jgi:hypothetical protein